jgi:alkanesulfonate monooxygenase SsuD/methylene tetrahydromethanopterin reductase-like flavin-dependent oxidoreductase (luciferase family)
MLLLPTPAVDRAAMLTWFRAVDERPFASLGVGDHAAESEQWDQLVRLSAAAAVTDRVRLVAHIMIVPMHPPVMLAKRLASLDVLSGGRFELATGVGGPRDFRIAERPSDHLHRRIDETVATMRRVWAGEPVFEGGLPVGPAPSRSGGPVLYASCQGPRSTERAARWADGYTGFKSVTEDLAKDAERVRTAWRRAGRTEPPYLMTGEMIAIGVDVKPEAPGHEHWPMLFTADELKQTIDEVEAAGFDELMLVTSVHDPRHLDRVAAVLTSR